MQPCKTGDQPYSDPSPNGECSLICLSVFMLEPKDRNLHGLKQGQTSFNSKG